MPRAEVVDLSLLIDGRQVFSHMTVHCDEGTMTALVGRSGSGKTSMLNCLGLLRRPTSGTVRIDGQDTSQWSPQMRRRFWRQDACFVLQEHGILDDETLAYNVSLTRGRFRRTGARKAVAESLERVGLASARMEEPAAHLSGGEKQRLGVARAIHKQATFLFVDEPTASLDDVSRTAVIQTLRERCEAGCVVVVATHDRELMDHADTLVQLS